MIPSEIEKLLKEKGISTDTWNSTKLTPDMTSRVKVIKELRELLQQQLEQDKTKLKQLTQQKDS